MTVCPLQEMEAQEEASEQQREAVRRRIVEEERQKLLKRHATQLLGFLPKVRRGEVMQCNMQVFVCLIWEKQLTICFCPSQGLLREEDLEHLDEDFRRNLQERGADEDGWRASD